MTSRTDESKNIALISRANSFIDDSMFKVEGKNLTLTDITLDGRKIETHVDGGIVYVQNGGSLTVTDGAVLQNSITTRSGAGIYLEQGSTLNLSGSPSFGGTDLVTQDDPESGKSAGDLKGQEGNFAVKGSDFKTEANEPVNGGKQYPMSGNSYLVRQDIFIAGYASDAPEATNAASLVVAGDIASGEGSIWVWAQENPHYMATRQFGKIGDGVSVSEETLNAFRNARDDTATENETGEYLRGTLEGDTAGCLYWNGVNGNRKVILRKVNSSYAPASGKSFTVYKGKSTNPYVVKDKKAGTSQTLSELGSLESGVFWIGNLTYGWYIVEEYIDSETSTYFYVVVTEKGVFEGPDKAGGLPSRSSAENMAADLYNAKK